MSTKVRRETVMRRDRTYLLTFCAAVALMVISGGAIVASPAAAYQDRGQEWVPPNTSGEVGSDTCDSSVENAGWKECESTKAFPQYHNWTEGTVTNELNTLGTVYVGVTEGQTLSGWKMEASAYGRFDTYAYTNALPHSYWPDLGVMGWYPDECLEGHGPDYNCYWESLVGKWDG